MQLEEILQKAGLNKQEIKVYLAGLESGPVLASKLAQKTGFSRTNTYNILKSLQEKGLVNKEGKGYSIHFTMEPPSRLKEQLERKKEEAAILEKELEKVLPTIKFTQPPFKTAPKVRVFEGAESFKNILGETLKEPTKETLSMIGGKEFEKIIDPIFLKHHVKKRVQLKIRNRTLMKKSALQEFPRARDKEELRETRYLPPNINIGTTVIIYGNNLAIISSQEENFGFIVESRELSHLFKIFFETFWEMSKKPKDRK